MKLHEVSFLRQKEKEKEQKQIESLQAKFFKRAVSW